MCFQRPACIVLRKDIDFLVQSNLFIFDHLLIMFSALDIISSFLYHKLSLCLSVSFNMNLAIGPPGSWNRTQYQNTDKLFGSWMLALRKDSLIWRLAPHNLCFQLDISVTFVSVAITSFLFIAIFIVEVCLISVIKRIWI